WNMTSPEVWVMDPDRKPGDTMSMLEFSGERIKMARQTITAFRKVDWAAPGGKIAIWELNFLDHEEGMRGLMRLSRTDGNMVSAVMGGMIEMRAEPEKV